MMQTIGQKLKAAREEKRLTLEKVFEDIRIRIPYLQALEADDLSIMPSPVQARGYLRNYAQYLDLNFDQLLNELRAETQTTAEIIGPAEDASTLRPSLRLEESISPTSQPESQIINSAEAPQIEDAVEETPLPNPPKPARRKKKDSPPQSLEVAADNPDTVQLPKRRGRKKVVPDPEPTIPIVESVPEQIEEPVTSTDSVQDVAEVPIEEVQPELLQEEPKEDINDNLWQSWMNRLGSVLSARSRRGTLVRRDTTIEEIDKESIAVVPEISREEATQFDHSEIKNNASVDWAEIFREIGRELRQRRELLSLHLEEVERNTHVKAHYLDALEKGAIDQLPSTVQTRGMLSNYATFLDLDVDALLLRFADALQAWHRERNPQKPARKPGQPIIAPIPSIRSFIAGDMIFGIGIAILLVGFSIWGVSRVLTIQSQQEVQPTAPSISDVLLASPEASEFTATSEALPAQIPGEATVTIVIPTQNLDVNVQVNLVAVERTYMRVIVDGEEVFNGRVVPGTAYPYQAET
ncbi:MAG TPA: helix-turn-helix domain-containing protein, partial [Anaerolineales bacterium]|nr:helix-turn-helix domain-containing protein [Anaerolineales bacterium]